MPKVLIMTVNGDQGESPIKEVYWLFCPACQDAVRITDKWQYNRDEQKPSFTPDIHTVIHDTVCHATLADGVWHYHEDSTHEYAGKDLEAVDVPAIGVDSQHV